MCVSILMPALVLALGLAAGPLPALAESAPTVGVPASVRIKPLMLPVIAANGSVEKYTQVEVTLELSDSTRLGEFQVALPRLQDAILTALYDGIASGWIVRGNIANGGALRKKLDEVTEHLIGKDTVSRVLITPVARQSSWP